MSKSAMCIKLLQVLNTGRIYKVPELAAILDTNPRNIIEYKRELEDCGYFINTVHGRYGGYQLDKSHLIPTFNLTDEDIKILDEANSYLLSRNDFMQRNKYLKVMSKIYSSFEKDNYDNNITVINRYPIAMSEEDLTIRYETIKRAIINKTALKFKYQSQKEESEFIYHPYDLFMYNNAWFVLGWSVAFNSVVYLKLNRISHITQLKDKFAVYKNYKKSDYIDEFGFKNNGSWYHIEFEAYDTYALLAKERIYGKNQEVIEVSPNKTIVKVDMQNKENVIKFILGFNKHIKLLEPQWLIDELRLILKDIDNIYNE